MVWMYPKFWRFSIDPSRFIRLLHLIEKVNQNWKCAKYSLNICDKHCIYFLYVEIYQIKTGKPSALHQLKSQVCFPLSMGQNRNVWNVLFHVLCTHKGIKFYYFGVTLGPTDTEQSDKKGRRKAKFTILGSGGSGGKKSKILLFCCYFVPCGKKESGQHLTISVLC